VAFAGVVKFLNSVPWGDFAAFHPFFVLYMSALVVRLSCYFKGVTGVFAVVALWFFVFHI
jgi:hypothetical protein